MAGLLRRGCHHVAAWKCSRHQPAWQRLRDLPASTALECLLESPRAGLVEGSAASPCCMCLPVTSMLFLAAAALPRSLVVLNGASRRPRC